MGIRGRSTGGRLVSERARIVIADGMNSLVARAIDAPAYDVQPTLTCAYYTYWSGVEMEGAELYPRRGRMIVAAPTSDGQVVTIVFWPNGEFRRVRSDIERNFLAALELAPGLAERVRGGTRADRFRGTSRLPNHFRRPYAGLSGPQSLDLALARYERRRNESAAGFERTIGCARLEPPPAEMKQLFAALQGDQEQTNRLFGTLAGTFPAAELFAPANLARIMGGAPAEAA